MSNFDFVCLQAHFYYATEDRFKCDEKILEYAKRSTYEKAEAMVRKANGCKVIADKVKYQINNIGYKSCFCTYRHPYFNTYLFLYKNYEKGLLPFEGNILDQPAYIIEVFNLIETLKLEKEAEDMAKQEKELERKNGRR